MRREFSAGGVVIRRVEGEIEIALVSPREGIYALPKGHPDPGESLEQAAAREVREETGLLAEPVEQLGEVRYWYRRSGRRIHKNVHFHLFRYVSGDTADHDHEVDEARWISLEEARSRLSYPGEREMIERALSKLAPDR